MDKQDYWVEEIKEILSEKRTESETLEFKSGEELSYFNRSDSDGPITVEKVKFDVLKDISAMANTSGGTIIYGIREKKSKVLYLPAAESVAAIPNDTRTLSIQAIESILKDNLCPSYGKYKITVIDASDVDPDQSDKEKIIVIEVQPGDTAHRVELTFKGYPNGILGKRQSYQYYERIFTSNKVMSGQRILDVMGRLKKPRIIVTPIWTTQINEPSCYELQFEIRNIGHITAINWKCQCEISGLKQIIVKDSKLKLSCGGSGFTLSNRSDSLDEVTRYQWSYRSKNVLFPSDTIVYPKENNKFTISSEALIENSQAQLRVILYADDMVPNEKVYYLGEYPNLVEVSE